MFCAIRTQLIGPEELIERTSWARAISSSGNQWLRRVKCVEDCSVIAASEDDEASSSSLNASCGRLARLMDSKCLPKCVAY